MKTNKKCLDGTRNHKHCEQIGEIVVCHVCEQSLGRKTEVWSRVVGYLRPISGWGPGKKQEYVERKEFANKELT